jgi:hypothetical protein
VTSVALLELDVMAIIHGIDITLTAFATSTDATFSRRCQEYGHTCRYERDLRKRGRKPTARKTSTTGSDVARDREEQAYQAIEPEPMVVPTASPLAGAIGEQHTEASDSHRDGHRLFSPSLWDNNGPISQGGLFVASPFVYPESFSPRTIGHTLNGVTAQECLDTVREEPRGVSQPTCSPEVNATSVADKLDYVEPSPGSSSGRIRPVRPYKCLERLLPLLKGIVSANVAYELLEFYFAQPGRSLFKSASPYVLTHVIRKRSLLHPLHPRKTTSALLCVMLWVSSQTADVPFLLLPGQRTNVSEALKRLALRLIQQRDRDHWERLPWGSLIAQADYLHQEKTAIALQASLSSLSDCPPQAIDDVLAYILLCIVISGSDFKNDCQMWWNKAVRLSQVLQLNMLDRPCPDTGGTCEIPCTCDSSMSSTLESHEQREEGRRVYWLLFCLDRHLALSNNSTLCIGDDECQVFIPLPEESWKNMESAIIARTYGPPTLVSGTGFFEWFLPLMTLLGDVVQVHHRRLHPRLGMLANDTEVELIETSLARCEQSIKEVERRFETWQLDGVIPSSELLSPTSTDNQTTPGSTHLNGATSTKTFKHRAQAQMVCAYSSFILHVIHVLLHGKWDVLSMLANDDDWIPSLPFAKCASHAISASEAVETILAIDPEAGPSHVLGITRTNLVVVDLLSLSVRHIPPPW